MASDKSRLIKNFLSLLSLRGLEFLIPLITIPYLLRTIGVEKYGLIGFGYAFTLYSGAVIQYGFSITATRDLARARQDKNEINRIFSEVFTTSIFLSIITTFISISIIILTPKLKTHVELNLICLLHVILQSLFPIWIFQGMERMNFITHLNLAARAVFLIGILFFVSEPGDYLIVPILSTASSFLLLAGAIFIATKEFKIYPKWTGFSSIRSTLKTGRHAFVNQLAPNLYNNSSTFILGLYATPNLFGLYSAATKVIDAAASIGYIISNTFLPYLSRNPENHKKFKAIMLIVGTLGTISLIALSQLIGTTLDPHHGEEIAELIKYMSPSVLAIFIILTFGSNYLMLHKKEKISANITLYTSLTFFFISLYLIPSLIVTGSIAILVGGRLAMAILLYLNYKKFHNHQ